MMTNARKAEIYRTAYETLEDGWTKRVLVSSDGDVCLVGSILEATPWKNERVAIQIDLANALRRRSRHAQVLALIARFRDLTNRIDPRLGGHPTAGDGGISFVETWNDSRFRRKTQVLKVLAERRDHYAALAKDDRIQELERENQTLSERLNELTASLEQLEIEISLLKVEVGFWKSRALHRKEREFLQVVGSSVEVVTQQEANSFELWELRTQL